MRKYPLSESIRQLALAMAGFAAVTLLVESDGLAHWAERLAVGPLRTMAVPATAVLKRGADPLGVPGARGKVLEELAHMGWSDDAALARSAQSSAPGQAGLCPAPASGAAAPGAVAAGVKAGPNPAAFAHAAGAQTQLAAAVPRSTELLPLPPIEPGRPRVVALAGDSMMAVGLSATLLRQAAGNPRLRMVKVFRSGTGLARPEVFNWMEEYPAMLGAEKPDVVIVAIGANDGQGFVVDGKVLACGTEEWRRVYQERLAGYLAMIGAGGARVVWVGLPPMRLPGYDEKIADINRIAYTVVSQAQGAAWWNPAPYVADDAGKFREFMPMADGKTLRVRASDGIHLSDEGAGLLTAVLLKWLDPPPAAVAAPAAAAPMAEKAAPPKKRTTAAPVRRGAIKRRPAAVRPRPAKARTQPGGGL